MITRVALPLMLCLIATPALSSERWAVLPIEVGRGLSPGPIEAFHELLVAEIGARNGAAFAQGQRSCSDVPCAITEGEALGASVVVFGKISKLGKKLIVTTNAVDLKRGQQVKAQRMSVNQVEDLEAVAARMATAIVEGGDTDDAARLGTITEQEVKPDRRREGHSGLSLRIGGAYLIDDLEDQGAGTLFEAGYWYEARDFAIEPRVSFQTSTHGDDEPGYRRFGVDVGTFFLLTRGDVAPFVGLGGGIRSITSRRLVEAKQGSVIQLDSSGLREDEGWGPGGFIRGGLMLFRTYTMRVALAGEYDINFIDLDGHTASQSFNFGVSVLF